MTQDVRLYELHGDDWSLILEQDGNSIPIWRHFGVRVDTTGVPTARSCRGTSTFSMDDDQRFDILPTGGSGWFGPPTISINNPNGAPIDVQFSTSNIVSSEDQLGVELIDEVSDVRVIILYISRAGAGLEICTSVKNLSDIPFNVARIASAIIPLPAQMSEIISWSGRHNSEFFENRESMPTQGWYRETRHGITGHGGPCGCYVLTNDAGWHQGQVIAMQLVWSGNARLAIEPTDEGDWVAVAEHLIDPSELTVHPASTYSAPPLLLATSSSGRNGVMEKMHSLTRHRIEWPGKKMRARPVHLNSWEACYFAHDEDRTLQLAESAAKLGVERFVLDDGWFQGRDNDKSGLGDWSPDTQKYPEGLSKIAYRANELGMEFGLWIEPEMVNPDSKLYREHPAWVLAAADRDRPTARNQLALDLRLEEVCDHLFRAIDNLLSETSISYLKWDHNRHHSSSGGAAQVRGSYELFKRVRSAHPNVEIESCAGGGGRIDAGIINYTHRFWASDNLDAVSRFAMQRGFLAFMPPEVMGAHVGAIPSHATGRSQSLGFRAAIACQGHLGVELDPASLTTQERSELSQWINFYKDWRHIIHGGSTILGEASDGVLWQAQGLDDELLLWVIRKDHSRFRHAQPITLPFATDRNWEISLLRHAGQTGLSLPNAGSAIKEMSSKPLKLSGSWLAGSGLPVPSLAAENALIYHLKAVS